MNEQLIEKLEILRKGLITINHFTDAGIISEAIQALTSVNSESAEEWETSLKIEAAIYEANEDNMYVEQAFIAGAKWMHDFANNSKAMKENAIGFAEFCQADEKCRTLDDLYTEYLTNKEKNNE